MRGICDTAPIWMPEFFGDTSFWQINAEGVLSKRLVLWSRLSCVGGISMGLLSWIFLGIVVGALAKWIMPGKDPGGILITTLIGIAGALIGGFLSTSIGLGTVTGFNFGSLVISVIGSLLLLGGYRRVRG